VGYIDPYGLCPLCLALPYLPPAVVSLGNAATAVAGGLALALGINAYNEKANDDGGTSSDDGKSCPAPGRPGVTDGYKEPKKGPRNADKDGRVRNPNGSGKGWPDDNGDVWVPTGGKAAHGGEHWDVQTPGRGGRRGNHRNVYPGGWVR